MGAISTYFKSPLKFEFSFFLFFKVCSNNTGCKACVYVTQIRCLSGQNGKTNKHLIAIKILPKCEKSLLIKQTVK